MTSTQDFLYIYPSFLPWNVKDKDTTSFRNHFGMHLKPDYNKQGQKSRGMVGEKKKREVCRDDQFEKVKNPVVKGTVNTRTRTAKS